MAAGGGAGATKGGPVTVSCGQTTKSGELAQECVISNTQTGAVCRVMPKSLMHAYPDPGYDMWLSDWEALANNMVPTEPVDPAKKVDPQIKKCIDFVTGNVMGTCIAKFCPGAH